MFYEKELRFLCDTFAKCFVSATTLHISSPVSHMTDVVFNFPFGDVSEDDTTIGELLGDIDERTVYKYTDRFCRNFTYLLLPSQRDRILLIGPYLSQPISQKQVFDMGSRIGISPQNMKYFEEYFSAIPVIEEKSPLFIMLSAFCERVWEQSSFAMINVNSDPISPISPINETARADSFDDVMLNIKTMEKRYKYENELMQAVSHGQLQKELELMSAFNPTMFEKRTPDPLRNAKNYSIIMNTLLRKAAESGGVHPIYLDRVSSEFALKIEKMSSAADMNTLMRDIFRSYCRLVRKHSMKSFSSVTQKAIMLIDSDLSAPLSLSSIAENQSISPGYLSTVFKRDTGKTVSEYIRDRRMKHAEHLLNTTHLQIQSVALHCGIMDVQYFSKTFKKYTGKTPNEYRKSIK